MSRPISQSVFGIPRADVARISPTGNDKASLPIDSTELLNTRPIVSLEVPSQAETVKQALAVEAIDKAALSNTPMNVLRYEFMKISMAISQMEKSESGQSCKGELDKHVTRLEVLQAAMEGQKRF